jgi:Methyltransferase domain
MQTNLAKQLLEETQEFEGTEHLVDVEGMSSTRICNFLNALVDGMDEGEHYLEVGTWQGRTLLSAAFRNPSRSCFACDKFRFFGRWTGWGHRAKRSLERNIERYRSDSAAVRFFHMTSERFFAIRRFAGSVGVYFYDGDHGYRLTRHGIVAASPLLSRRSVVLVDDWNGEVVRQATRDGLRDARLDVLWEREFFGDRTPGGWWNGLGVFYVEKR